MGYTQTYYTDDGQPLSEGVSWNPSPSVIKERFQHWISDAKQVVERVPKFRNHRGEVGERIILINRPDELGRGSVSILFYDGGGSYRFIDAPTLDLAFEFEKYLISIDFKSPM